MFGFWVNSWLLGRFFCRFLDFGWIFGLSDDFWLFCTIFGYLVDFFSFGLIFVFSVNIWLLGQFLAIGNFLSISGLWFNFSIVGQFLAFWTIFGFLDDFCHLS